MTAPRQVLPGTTYLVTRRCAQRQFLLRPSPATNGLFRYVLAVAARLFGVRVHAFCVLSNHFHLIVSDPEARLPAFAQYLASLVARALNLRLGRTESFWGPASYSAVALLTPEAIVEKTAYVLANPVAAGLVERGRDWPGLWSDPAAIGQEGSIAERPAFFFRKAGPLAESALVELTTPPGFASPESFREEVMKALTRHEAAARRAMQRAGRSVLGAARAAAQRPTGRAAARERRGGLNPRVAGRDKWKRIEALGRLVAFVDAYRAAWAAFRAGFREVLFPPGTYGPRVTHGVRCAAAV
jgi:putative transposase